MSEEDKVEQHEHPHSSAGKEKGQDNVLIAKKYYIYCMSNPNSFTMTLYLYYVSLFIAMYCSKTA